MCLLAFSPFAAHYSGFLTPNTIADSTEVTSMRALGTDVVFFQTEKKVAPSSTEHSSEEGQSRNVERKSHNADVSFLSVIFFMLLLCTLLGY